MNSTADRVSAHRQLCRIVRMTASVGKCTVMHRPSGPRKFLLRRISCPSGSSSNCGSADTEFNSHQDWRLSRIGILSYDVYIRPAERVFHNRRFFRGAKNQAMLKTAPTQYGGASWNRTNLTGIAIQRITNLLPRQNRTKRSDQLRIFIDVFLIVRNLILRVNTRISQGH